MSESTKDNDVMKLMDSEGLLDQKYRDWCMTHPGKLLRDGEILIHNLDEVKELLSNYVKEFHETSPDIFDDIINCNDLNVKNDDASILLREKGNSLYQAKQFKAAIDCYNKAISHAKDNSKLALAFANRSAVLFQENEMAACLRDIDRATKSGYPDNLVHKLLDRKGKCLMKLGHYSEAIIVLGEAVAKARKNVEEEKKLNLFLSDVQKSLKVCSSKKSGSLPLKGYDKEETGLPMLTGANPQMPAFSKAVEIAHSQKVGRHGLATRNIGCGEIILIERSLFNFVKLEKRGEVCSHCLGTAKDLIPSPINSKDMFCSRECLENALNSYHSMESELLSSLEKSDLIQEEWFIALRAVLKKPLSFFLENRKEFRAASADKTFPSELKEDQKFISNDYTSLFTLQTNETLWNVQYLHLSAYVSYFFIHCLTKVGYFGSLESQQPELSRDQLFMADVLLQLMNASSTNALETGVCNLQEKSSMLENDIAEVGGSLEPSLVLLNHSCDPNTIRINCQGHIILMANRNISEGQEISIGYYLTYAETDMEARQKYLKRKYLFDCKCPACAEKWPTKDLMPKSFDDLNENQMMFDMENTMMLMQQVNKIQKVGSSISQEQRAGNYKKAFGLCIEFIKVLQDTLKKPHSYYLMAEKSLFKLAWILHGSHLR